MTEQTMKDLNVEFTLKDSSEMDGKYLTFWTDSQLFGVPIADVVQIVGMQEITQMPEYPAYAKGVMNLRGEIIPLIDMRLRLGKYEKEYNDRTCVIVTNLHEAYFGFIVDEVDEVTDVSDEQISLPPQVSGESTDRFLTGIAKLENKLVLLVSTSKLLGESEFEPLQ